MSWPSFTTIFRRIIEILTFPYLVGGPRQLNDPGSGSPYREQGPSGAVGPSPMQPCAFFPSVVRSDPQREVPMTLTIQDLGALGELPGSVAVLVTSPAQ